MTSRISSHHCLGTHIVSDNASSANHGLSSNADARQNRAIGSKTGTAFDNGDERGCEVLFRARKLVVAKCCVGTHKYVIFKRDTIPYLDTSLRCNNLAIGEEEKTSDLNTILDGYAIPHFGTSFNKHMFTNVALLANHSAFHHMSAHPDPSVCAHHGSIINDSLHI